MTSHGNCSTGEDSCLSRKLDSDTILPMKVAARASNSGKSPSRDGGGASTDRLSAES